MMLIACQGTVELGRPGKTALLPGFSLGIFLHGQIDDRNTGSDHCHRLL